MEPGPIMLAPGANLSTVLGSALGRQPATTSGPELSDFIRWIILLAVASFTEQVTMTERSDSAALSATVCPPFTIRPEIISESAELAEHPYASTCILAISTRIPRPALLAGASPSPAPAP